MAKKDNDEKQPIIIKRVKKVSGGHHGGAWKVAYADFVTAMMAFFLLLWLLNVTTKEQKNLISSYFAPTDPRISQTESGAGGLMGGLSMSPEGAMRQNRVPVASPKSPAGEGDGAGQEGDTEESAVTDEKLLEEMEKRDEKAFRETEEKLKQAIESVPELKDVANNLLIDMTPEGLRIQIVDQDGKPMFALGSAKPLPAAEKLLRLVGQAVRDLPNKISVRGHTDSKPYGKDAAYTNWELSSDRANASRRVMLDNGVALTRVENVQGKADREPLKPNDPEAAQNRRISVILLKQSLFPGIKKTPAPAGIPAPKAPDAPQTKKREEGVIYFP
jgi:chemotaxis protein MotB